MTPDTRLAELELKFTEQAHALEELSDVVYAQQKAIDGLMVQVRHLESKLEAVEQPGLVDAGRQDKPPHY